MGCPNCKQEFNIEDKNSGYQVNDLTELTYCSFDCSSQHLFNPESLPNIIENMDKSISEEVLIEWITEEIDSTKFNFENVKTLSKKIIFELNQSV